MENKENVKTEAKSFTNMGRKIFVYILGLFIIALGVSVSVKSNLGVSPVNSIPYVLSLITGIEQGKCVTAVFISFIALQALILLKEFEVKNLLQIICSTIFGYFVTAANKLTAGVPECGNYGVQLFYLLISMCLIAIGISLFLKADLILMPAEGVTGAIAKKFGVKFPNAKSGCDIAMVIIAAALSMIFFKELRGVREGTLIAAIFIGQIMKVWRRFADDKITKFLEG